MSCFRKFRVLRKSLSIMILGILLIMLTVPVFSQHVVTVIPDRLSLETRGTVIRGVPFTLKVSALDSTCCKLASFHSEVVVSAGKGRLFTVSGDKKIPLTVISGFKGGEAEISNVMFEDTSPLNSITAECGNVKTVLDIKQIPGILTILPPLLAIILALTMRQVIVSIFCGVWLGAVFIYDFNPFTGLMRVVDTIMVNALATTGHESIILFDIFLAGMVAVIARSGGSMGMVKIIQKWAKTPQLGQIATYLMGLAIFFDDYANTLIVGNSMRPLTDKLKISREKLSFIVDATAAPVTNVALISTWIGFEISVIGDSLKAIGVNREPYMVFVQTIPYRFYPVMLIFFVLLVAWMMRDFGPMLKAEVRARKTGEVLSPTARPLSDLDEKVLEKGDVPERWYNAVVPILSVVFFTILGLWQSGIQKIIEEKGAVVAEHATIFDILNNSNSFHALLWASFFGSVLVIVMVTAQKIMTLEESLNAWVEGAKSIMPALIILCLAWCIGDICQKLNTGSFLATIAQGSVMPQLLPFLIFILSACISFATGTSWGTMSIVMPIAVFVAYQLPPQSMPEYLKTAILFGSISGVLAGATFGDHCSPISDTTIMSSMASASDHIDHVRTQMPYALIVALVGVLVGTIPIGFGANPFLCQIVGIGILFLILRFIGKNAETIAEKEIQEEKEAKKTDERLPDPA